MKAVTRNLRASHEHEFEAAPGLPEALPAGERVLWQGRPEWRALAVDAFHVRGVAFYFAALLAVSVALRISDGATLAEAARGAAMLFLLFAFALGMLLMLAWMSARTSLYTLTNRRLVMRVGIVLTLTFNLPLKFFINADLRLRRGDTGNIALRIAPPDRIAIVHLWPHARPWRIGSPEPMLRCIPDAANVADALRAAWASETGLAPASARQAANHDTASAEPALA